MEQLINDLKLQIKEPGLTRGRGAVKIDIIPDPQSYNVIRIIFNFILSIFNFSTI